VFKRIVKNIAAFAYWPFCGSCRKVVLCYHSLKREAVESFKKQMDYLASHYRIVKPSRIPEEQYDGRKIVALTFDDAFKSFYENAVGVLKELNIPAGVFVPTGFMGQKCGWQMPPGHRDENEVVINRQQIIELEKDGIEVFCHTVTHSDLSRLSDVFLRQELTESKAALEAILKHAVNGISYPHGLYHDRVLDIAKECGYQLGFTLDPQWAEKATNNLAIGRFLVSPGDGLLTLKLKADGAYAAQNVLRYLKHQIW